MSEDYFTSLPCFLLSNCKLRFTGFTLLLQKVSNLWERTRFVILVFFCCHQHWCDVLHFIFPSPIRIDFCLLFYFPLFASFLSIKPLINSTCGGSKNSLRCFQNGVCELCENMFISSIRVQVHCTVKITKNVLLQILYIFVEGMWPRP